MLEIALDEVDQAMMRSQLSGSFSIFLIIELICEEQRSIMSFVDPAHAFYFAYWQQWHNLQWIQANNPQQYIQIQQEDHLERNN